MKNVEIQAFKVIGIAVRTTNENNQAATDIGGLWAKFMGEGIQAQIPNKVDQSILSIYTNYESDHTKAYDTILGCRVNSLDEIPEGMVGVAFGASKSAQFLAKGDLTQGAVYQAWAEIWNEDLNRSYNFDFEEYGASAADPQNAEVDIYVTIK